MNNLSTTVDKRDRCTKAQMHQLDEQILAVANVAANEERRGLDFLAELFDDGNDPPEEDVRTI